MRLKCETCKMHYQGFHVCIIDKETPEGLRWATQEVRPRKKPNYSPKGKKLVQRSEEHAENHALAMREYWDNKRAAEKPVWDAIVAEYAEGKVGYAELAEKYPYNREKIARILRQAAAEGRVTLRKRGQTIRNERMYD